MIENVVSDKIAKETIESWLNHKNVHPRKREMKDTRVNIEVITYAICDGDLILDDDFNLVQNLRNPVMDKEGKVVLNELSFKPRLLMGDVENSLMNVKSDNSIGMLAAYTSALTGVNSGLVRKIDTDDNKVAQAIVMFFL